MRIGIINYGMGNLGSIQNALESLGADSFIMGSPDMLETADRIILPGVGAFRAAVEHLEEDQWIPAIKQAVLEQKRPLLGICLGMQLLLSSGDEGGHCKGLGFIEGEVKRLQLKDASLRVPHMGWNEVDYTCGSPIFQNIPDQSDFYFVHSYAAIPVSDDDVVARTKYGGDFVVAIRRKNVFGVQFHPEKSSIPGRKLLQNFLEYQPC
jgi:glutamine amidotransferase